MLRPPRATEGSSSCSMIAWNLFTRACKFMLPSNDTTGKCSENPSAKSDVAGLESPPPAPWVKIRCGLSPWPRLSQLMLEPLSDGTEKVVTFVLVSGFPSALSALAFLRGGAEGPPVAFLLGITVVVNGLEIEDLGSKSISHHVAGGTAASCIVQLQDGMSAQRGVTLPCRKPSISCRDLVASEKTY